MKTNRCSNPIATILFLFLVTGVSAHRNPLYENLPVGKYAVGFKIITLTDDTRVSKPEHNYLGEKNEGDRSRKITIHLWYPALNNSAKPKLSFEDYCYNDLLTSIDKYISVADRTAQVNRRRGAIEGWFGKTTDDLWKKLLATSMLATAEAAPLKEKFPLLIGMLRPLSTSVTNELMASNGYVVAMVFSTAFESFAIAALSQVPDMQFVINYLKKEGAADINKLGVFGFSGSGFVPVLFSNFDHRVKALADIESGIYMEGLFQGLAASNYYDPSKLRIPFLHIFSRDLSKQEKYIEEFEKKARFSKRYRLLLNQPALHHWDFATEGYTAALMLNNRGAEQVNIRQSFEISSVYLLNFFNAELRGDPRAMSFVNSKPALPEIRAALWDITTLDPIKAAPTKDELEHIIRTRGIREALAIVRNTLKNDSSSNIIQGFAMNDLGYTFLREHKFQDAIEVFKLNTEMHPDDANFFDSLAEGYELSGDKENMKKVSANVMDMLSKKATLTNDEKTLQEVAGKRLNK